MCYSIIHPFDRYLWHICTQSTQQSANAFFTEIRNLGEGEYSGEEMNPNNLYLILSGEFPVKLWSRDVKKVSGYPIRKLGEV